MALTGGDPSRAPWLMTHYGCAGCHTIGGIPGADGKVGPPLKGLIERVYIGGTAPNNAENLVRWLVEPQRFAPHAAMPPPGLDEGEARDIAAYLYAHYSVFRLTGAAAGASGPAYGEGVGRGGKDLI